MRALLLLLCLVCRRVPGFRPPPPIRTSWRLASSPSEDLYEALGVPSTADDSMLRRAYVKRAKLLHPDVNPSPEAATDFRRIAEAYEVLRDERKRKRYDNELFADVLRAVDKEGLEEQVSELRDQQRLQVWRRGCPRRERLLLLEACVFVR